MRRRIAIPARVIGDEIKTALEKGAERGEIGHAVSIKIGIVTWSHQCHASLAQAWSHRLCV